MDGLKSFLTARYGYLLVMMATVLVGIVALARALDRQSGDSGHLIAAAVAFGAATLSSRGR